MNIILIILLVIVGLVALLLIIALDVQVAGRQPRRHFAFVDHIGDDRAIAFDRAQWTDFHVATR